MSNITKEEYEVAKFLAEYFVEEPKESNIVAAAIVIESFRDRRVTRENDKDRNVDIFKSVITYISNTRNMQKSREIEDKFSMTFSNAYTIYKNYINLVKSTYLKQFIIDGIQGSQNVNTLELYNAAMRLRCSVSLNKTKISDDTELINLYTTLGVRVYHALYRSNIKTVGDLRKVANSEDKLMKVRCIGKNTAKELKELIDKIDNNEV